MNRSAKGNEGDGIYGGGGGGVVVEGRGLWGAGGGSW